MSGKCPKRLISGRSLALYKKPMNFQKKSRIIKKNSRNFPKKLKDLKKLKVLEAVCLRLPPKNWAKKGPDLAPIFTSISEGICYCKTCVLLYLVRRYPNDNQINS